MPEASSGDGTAATPITTTAAEETRTASPDDAAYAAFRRAMDSDETTEQQARQLFDAVRVAASHGHGPSLRLLGCFYAHGAEPFVAQSDADSLASYARAAEAGDAPAQRWLGVVHERGLLGVTADLEKALGFYRQAAEQGDATAQWLLGLCLANGKGCERDDAAAVELFQKSAAQGNAVAQREIGVRHYYGDGLPLDPLKACEAWLAAGAEDTEAFYLVGVAHFERIGFQDFDFVRAEKCLSIAARRGHAGAQYLLGKLHRLGFKDQITKDLDLARSMFEKAAAQGLPWAHTALGEMDIEVDPVKAVDRYQRAADLGDVDAQVNLAAAYAFGNGVAKDEAKARALLEAAAQSGDGKARELLQSGVVGISPAPVS